MLYKHKTHQFLGELQKRKNQSKMFHLFNYFNFSLLLNTFSNHIAKIEHFLSPLLCWWLGYLYSAVLKHYSLPSLKWPSMPNMHLWLLVLSGEIEHPSFPLTIVWAEAKIKAKGDTTMFRKPGMRYLLTQYTLAFSSSNYSLAWKSKCRGFWSIQSFHIAYSI